MTNTDKNSALTASTLGPQNSSAIKLSDLDATVLCLGIIWHPSRDRIGEVARLVFDKAGNAELSRLVPIFGHPNEDTSHPLLDKHISRTPITIFRHGPRSFRFSYSKPSVRVTVNGRSIAETFTAEMDELGADIVINIADTVVLSLFYASTSLFNQNQDTDLGFLGISRSLTDIRGSIQQIANTEIPVLIRGETGTGKELIARAIHDASTSGSQELVTFNMATLSSELAPAELFGVKKGAFTGADHDKIGLFEQADEGTLFLDEIGDTPPSVQPMLLRALELGEIRPVGGTKTRKVHTRIIAATDRDLDAHDGKPAFNQPLLQRLQGLTIDIPPLRERRIDIGLLLQLMLKDFPQVYAAISAGMVEELAMYNWPGNVRELHNIARSLSLGQPVRLQAASVEPTHNKTIKDPAPPPTRQTRTGSYKHITEVDEASLLSALNETDWVIMDAARKLGISRTSLYELMAKSSVVRRVEDISTDELRTVIASVPGGVSAWAKHLRVGKSALQRKVRQISSSYAPPRASG